MPPATTQAPVAPAADPADAEALVPPPAATQAPAAPAADLADPGQVHAAAEAVPLQPDALLAPLAVVAHAPQAHAGIGSAVLQACWTLPRAVGGALDAAAAVPLRTRLRQVRLSACKEGSKLTTCLLDQTLVGSYIQQTLFLTRHFLTRVL